MAAEIGPVFAAVGAVAASNGAAELGRLTEEQQLTGYSEQNLADGWEFKILRSITGAFRLPEVLKQVREEEAAAGWVLVEKFDNGRLRFKRPAAAAAKDGDDPAIDPYRSEYGLKARTIVLIVYAVVSALILISLTMRFILP